MTPHLRSIVSNVQRHMAYFALVRECPEAVLPDRALYLPPFSHLLIVNKPLLVSLLFDRQPYIRFDPVRFGLRTA